MSDEADISEVYDELQHQRFQAAKSLADHSNLVNQPPNTASPEPDITVTQKMIAACSGSLLTSLVVTPFDVVRVRLQQQGAFPIDAATMIARSKNIPAHLLSAQTKSDLKQVISSTIPHSSNPSLSGTLSSSSSSLPHVSHLPFGSMSIPTCCKNVPWYPSTLDYCVASELSLCAKEEALKRRFSGTWEGLRKINAFEGPQALWRGLGLTLLMSFPSNVVYFIGYEYLRDSSPVQHPLLTPLVAGGFARTLSATVVSPIELLKTRLQSVSSSSPSEALRNVLKGTREMVASQGIFSLWRGLVLTLWRDVPFSAIYWTAVEVIRKEIGRSEYIRQHPEHKFSENFVAGCVGGSIAAICTSPFDVGKTRRQVGHHSTSSGQLGMFSLLRSIARNEGVSALFVGSVPRVLKVAPACAIMITSYETGKAVFKRWNGLG